MNAAETRHPPPGSRHKARRLALQALYQWLVADPGLDNLLDQFATLRSVRGANWGYTRALVHGAVARRKEIETSVAACLDRPIQQLDTVEHAVLLLGGYELLRERDVPVSVVIDESVNLAREFGATDSYKYINGVLDRLAKELRRERPDPTSA